MVCQKGPILVRNTTRVLACSSPTNTFPADDAGADGTAADTGKTDGALGDGSKPDGGADGTVPSCTDNIEGECNLVSQNCQPGNECVLANSGDGGNTTKCQPIGTGALVKGSTCVASGSSNPCVKGTACISGRCAPACCFGDNSNCGNSIPEGFTGECILNIVDKNDKKLYSACTYNAACKPFGIEACPTDYACLVKDVQGTATCTTIYQPPGKAELAPCTVANDCKDGMMCLGTADGGSICEYVCYKGGGPFDAGISSGPSGKGGCSLLKKTCTGSITNLPTWLGICQ